MLPLAGRPNFAVTGGRFNPIQCPFKSIYMECTVFQLGFEKDTAVGRWRILLCVNDIFEGTSLKYVF